MGAVAVADALTQRRRAGEGGAGIKEASTRDEGEERLAEEALPERSPPAVGVPDTHTMGISATPSPQELGKGDGTKLIRLM